MAANKITPGKALLLFTEVVLCVCIVIPGLLACLMVYCPEFETHNIAVKPFLVTACFVITLLLCVVVVALCDLAYKTKRR